MLKWLVTKGPSSTVPLEKVVTDDPLATISRKHKKYDPIYAVSRVNPIFEEDDSKESISNDISIIIKTTKSSTHDEHPESPPTDRESVRSSGYGSKEADSVSFKSSDSQEDEEEPFFKDTSDDSSSLQKTSGQKKHNQRQRKEDHFPNLDIIKDNNDDRELEYSSSFGSPGTVAELRKSFETISSQGKIATNQVEILKLNPSFVGSIEIGSHRPPLSNLEVIPEASESAENSPSKPSWPRVSHLAENLQRQADLIHERRERDKLKVTQGDSIRNQILRFNPLVSVVAQNRHYVTAISVSPKEKERFENNSDSSSFTIEPNFSLNMKTEKPVPAYFQHNKGICNTEFPLLSLQPDSLVNEDTIKMMKYPEMEIRSPINVGFVNYTNPVDMPDFGRAIYSNFYSTHRSGSSSTSSRSGAKHDRNFAIVRTNSAKKKGLNVVKDLWEKTGLKTNGRKLLVNVNDLITDDNLNNHLTVSRKSSYGSTEDYRSLHSSVGQGSSQYKQLSNGKRTPNNRRSSSAGSYVDIYERGIDNPTFIDDKGQVKDTVSIHSRSSFQFQHNLTDFQRRVGEKLQNDSSHRQSSKDVERAFPVSNNSSLRESMPGISYNTNGIIMVIKEKFASKSKDKNMPGKAVREFGLEDEDYRNHRWSGENDSKHPTSTNFGYHNQKLFWKSSNGNYGDRSLSGIFSLHPNSEAPICGDSGEQCRDFTIDPRKNQRNMKKSSKNKRQKRCCSILVVLLAFVFFIGMIVAVSWFYTGGERIFGPM